MTTDEFLEMKKKLHSTFDILMDSLQPDEDNAICISDVEAAAEEVNTLMYEFNEMLLNN